MSRYRIPDHLICLGGGGNEIGETFMKQNWILEEVLKTDPRPDVDAPDQDSHPLRAFFIDTDNSTLPADIVDDIYSRVEKIEDQHNIQRHQTVDATVINIAEGTHEQYLQADHVAAPATVGELLTDQGLNAWWLENQGDNAILSPLDGLTRGGVDRKRGLTKAISRIYEWQHESHGNNQGRGSLEQIGESIVQHDNPNVAMVVGLGGGTGSGLLVDIARRVKEAGATLTLFGVLPTPSGRDKASVMANAYSTLSELEYLALSESNFFRNIILIPYDPAVDDDRFDKSVTYTITSYYNLSANQTNTYSTFDETDDIDGPPLFAPFTLASTRYLHYLREDIDKTRQNFESYKENKKDALNAEEDLLAKISTYIEENHPEAAAHLYTTDEKASLRLPSGDAVVLNDRLKDVYELLNQDFMKEIEFWSANKVAEAFEDIKDTSKDEAEPEDESDKEAAVARDFISRLADNINSPSEFEPTEEWAANEREFIEMVIKEFELVAQRAGIIRAYNAIRENNDEDTQTNKKIAVDIKNAIDQNDGGYGTAIESIAEKTENKKSELEKEIENLDSFVTQATDRVESLKDDWESDVKSPVEEYYSLYQKREDIEKLIADLKEEINNEVNGLAEKQEESNILSGGTDFNEYTKLNDLLVEVGCDPVDKAMIENSIKAAKKARKKQLKAQTRSNTIKETALSLVNMGTIGGLRTDYQTLHSSEINNQILNITPWSDEFDAYPQYDYLHDRLSDLEDREEELINRVDSRTQVILEEIEKDRENPRQWYDEPDVIKEFLTEVDVSDDAISYKTVTNHFNSDEHKTITESSTSEQFVTELKSQPVEALLRSALVEPFANLKESKEEELSKINNQLDAYETLQTIVSNKGGAYASAIEDVESIDEISILEDSGGDDPFRKEVEPFSRGKLGNSKNLGDTKLWEDDNERAELLDALEDVLPQIGGPFLPITERYISDSETHQVDYDDYRLGSVFMSPLFDEFVDDETAKIPEVTQKLVDNRQFDQADYLASRGAFADAYDFSMTTFLSGVFLDNLEIFTNNCRDAYTSATDVETSEDRYNHMDHVPRIVQHHTYALDGVVYHDEDQFLPDESDGGFVYRHNVLNFNSDGTKFLLDQAKDNEENEKKVVEKLLNDCYEIVGYSSTVDPN